MRLLTLERVRTGKRERNVDRVGWSNPQPRERPDWESNVQPFGAQDDTPTRATIKCFTKEVALLEHDDPLWSVQLGLCDQTTLGGHFL